MQQLPASLNPSGLNDRSIGAPELSFADYILKIRQMLCAARMDLSPQTTDAIVDANSAFEWHPSPQSIGKIQRGVLLVHGLFDCPFMLHDIGRFFQAQGFLVRAILLPGHGTVPADLLHIDHQEWIKAVDYGVASLLRDVEEVSIVGFSLGGLLAVYKALQHNHIKHLLLIAPALKLRAEMPVKAMMFWKKYLSWLSPLPTWYQKKTMATYCKYNAYCCNAPMQLQMMIEKTNRLLQYNTLSIPIFLVASAADNTISTPACLAFFSKQKNLHSRLLLYTSQSYKSDDARIMVQNSYLPEQKILDFAHCSLPISPDNPLFGVYGKQPDFMHYPGNKPPVSKEIFLGETSKTNLAQHVIQRLSYNPDFSGMIQKMGEFLTL